MTIRKRAVGAGLAASIAIAAPLLSPLGSSPAAATSPVKIAFFLGALTNNYQKAQLTGLKQGAAAYGGVIAKVYDSQNFSAATQVSQIQDALASKQYQAFAITPNDGGAVTPVIRQALAAGIKVVCISADCGPNPIATTNQIPGMTTTIALPYYENGKDLAKLIIQACAKKNPCRVIYMPGDNTLPLETARTKGLNSVLSKHPSIKIVADQQGGYDLGTARSVMQNELTANPTVDVAASAYDVMTDGIQQAIKADGVKRHIALIGSGGDSQSIALVKNKTWFGTISAIPVTEGRLAAKYLIEAVHGTKNIPSWIDEYKLEPGGAIRTYATSKNFTAQYTG